MGDGLYQEAMYLAKEFGIPELLVNSYYDAFVEFVREEIDKRIKTGTTTKINTDIFLDVVMSESGWGR